MRVILSALMLTLAASPALAQSSFGQNPAQTFQNLTPQDAARLNEAAKSDPKARQALDHVEKELVKAGHPSGTMMQKTR